ncbi:transposable element Tc3 transposase [Trichonephila clavipes]|nr:transposable element Tc3 transposase [Trichonephila clavipes]
MKNQIWSSVDHIKNLTLLSSSKYSELNGQAMLSEWMKTALLKKFSMPIQLALEEEAVQILDGLMAQKKITYCQVIYSQFGLAIYRNDHQARRRFVEWAQNEIAIVPDFHKRVLFSDEAHFWLNGYVNKQNCRIWSEANPQVYVETPLHPEKLTVWCALWAGGIIGPYFFKNDEGHNVTVNGDRYRAMITNFFIPELNNHDVQELWFQQDGATCDTARATIDLLKDTFGDRLISHFGPVNWPPRSCDLTPLDYFLWGYVKSLVYVDKPQTLDHLEDNIRRVIANIRPEMLEKVIENWTSRLDYIRASRGSHMPEIIFKIKEHCLCNNSAMVGQVVKIMDSYSGVMENIRSPCKVKPWAPSRTLQGICTWRRSGFGPPTSQDPHNAGVGITPLDSWPAYHEFELCAAQRRPMHVKYVEVQTSPVDVGGGSGASSGAVLVTCPQFKITRSITKSPQVAE